MPANRIGSVGGTNGRWTMARIGGGSCEGSAIDVRSAIESDAQAMSEVLEELRDAGQRTRAVDPGHVLSHYIEHPQRVECSVAVDDRGRILGFQSLKISDAGNPYETPVGWGIIGTHVRPSAARRGVGSTLFAASVAAAHEAGLPKIEAFIGKGNPIALAYYDALGFRTYRTPPNAVCKSFEVQ